MRLHIRRTLQERASILRGGGAGGGGGAASGGSAAGAGSGSSGGNGGAGGSDPSEFRPSRTASPIYKDERFQPMPGYPR